MGRQAAEWDKWWDKREEWRWTHHGELYISCAGHLYGTSRCMETVHSAAAHFSPSMSPKGLGHTTRRRCPRDLDAGMLPVIGTTPALEEASPSVRLLRLPDVMRRIGMKRTAVYALMKEGSFPAPVKVGGASAWVDYEITQWIEGLMAARSPAPRPRK